MAMIDYGAIVFKNGEFINKKEFFMDMEKSVGWADWKNVRYPDCPRVECVMGDDYSPCTQCPDCHYNKDTYSWTDCKGVSFVTDNHLKGNYYAYIGDKDFTIAFYKCFFKVTINQEVVGDVWGNREDSGVKDKDGFTVYINHKSKVWKFGDYKIHVKTIGPTVFLANIHYKGNWYHVIYGYGIDPTPEVWNNIKVRYLGKRVSNRVDRLIEKYWTKKGN